MPKNNKRIGDQTATSRGDVGDIRGILYISTLLVEIYEIHKNHIYVEMLKLQDKLSIIKEREKDNK
jgi:hypothetical protein